MANTISKLYAGAPSTDSLTLFTSPASTKTIVKSIIMNNTAGSNATISLSFAGVEVFTAYSIAANETIDKTLSLVLESGDTISGLQGTAGAINVYISGVKIV
jgi:hypothetical protein